MIDDSRLPVTQKDSALLVALSPARSSLIARGREDAAMLIFHEEAEAPQKRASPYLFGLEWGSLDRPTDGSIEEIRDKAEKGDAKSQNFVALLYSCWRERPGRWLEESSRMYRRAAEQGYAPAQCLLGWLYDASPYQGENGVEQDYVEAAKWYRKAADQGFVPAQFNLGLMYDSGEGVAQDYVQAVKWYRLAAERGLDTAQFNLGLKYFKGQGVVRDYIQAHKWMTVAAESDHFDKNKSYAAMRDRIAVQMTPSQIAEAQLLAHQWTPKNVTSKASESSANDG